MYGIHTVFIYTNPSSCLRSYEARACFITTFCHINQYTLLYWYHTWASQACCSCIIIPLDVPLRPFARLWLLCMDLLFFCIDHHHFTHTHTHTNNNLPHTCIQNSIAIVSQRRDQTTRRTSSTLMWCCCCCDAAMMRCWWDTSTLPLSTRKYLRATTACNRQQAHRARALPPSTTEQRLFFHPYSSVVCIYICVWVYMYTDLMRAWSFTLPYIQEYRNDNSFRSSHPIPRLH